MQFFLSRPLAAAKIIAAKPLSPKSPLRGHKEKGKRNGHKKVKNKGEQQKFKEAEERYKTLKKKEL
jgi:hypothetical protein